MLFRSLEFRRDSRVTKGISGFLLCWPREAQSSIRVARESWDRIQSGNGNYSSNLNNFNKICIYVIKYCSNKVSYQKEFHLLHIVLPCF